jgi:hypothetical protein
VAGIKFFAHGTVVSVNSVDVEGIVNISLPGGDVDEVETTDSDSNRVREYVAGLSDSGVMTMEMRYIPGATGQGNLQTLKAAGTTVENVNTLPASSTSDSDVATLTFDGYVRTFDRELPTVEGAAASATSEIRVTGAIAEAVT